MIKTILPSIVAISFLLCHCTSQNTDEPSVKFHGCSHLANNTKAVKINVAKYSNYIDLYKAIEQLVCKDSIPIIDISSQTQEEYVMLSNPCWEDYVSILIKRRNVLSIVDDSIRVQRSYPLDSLESLIVRHYFNPHKLPYHSESPKKALVTVRYKHLDSDRLRSTLQQITQAYSKIGYSQCLSLWLDRPPIPPPAPAPAPANIVLD